MKAYKTYIFDFDYTLADASTGILKCFRHVLDTHKHTNISDDAIRNTIGKTLEQAFIQLTKITDKATIDLYVKEYVNMADIHMTANTKLFPEVLTVLTTLKDQGVQLGIVSTKFRYRIIEFVNQVFPTDFFDVIIGGEDVTQHKPSPEGLLLALTHLKAEKDQYLYIGDSTIDAETAQAIAADFYGVLNGTTTREQLAQYPHIQIGDNLSHLIHKSSYK